MEICYSQILLILDTADCETSIIFLSNHDTNSPKRRHISRLHIVNFVLLNPDCTVDEKTNTLVLAVIGQAWPS